MPPVVSSVGSRPRFLFDFPLFYLSEFTTEEQSHRLEHLRTRGIPEGNFSLHNTSTRILLSILRSTILPLWSVKLSLHNCVNASSRQLFCWGSHYRHSILHWYKKKWLLLSSCASFHGPSFGTQHLCHLHRQIVCECSCQNPLLHSDSLSMCITVFNRVILANYRNNTAIRRTFKT